MMREISVEEAARGAGGARPGGVSHGGTTTRERTGRVEGHAGGGQSVPRKSLFSILTSVHGAVLECVRRILLPEGFPHSVTEDYLEFQSWDSVQALCSYIRGTICTTRLLEGVGVGSDVATPASATVMFITRDMTGMLARIVFAVVKGSGFDAQCKQWRLFADNMNNIGLVFDLVAPIFKERRAVFLLIICVSSSARSLCGVAANASRAAMTQHFARGKRQNQQSASFVTTSVGDISAKEDTQETLTTLVGMLLGLIVSQYVDVSMLLTLTIFIILTILHVYANYRAVRSLTLRSLNRSRLSILWDSFKSKFSCDDDGSLLNELVDQHIVSNAIMSPHNVTQVEQVLSWQWSSSSDIILGSKLTAFLDTLQHIKTESDDVIGLVSKSLSQEGFAIVCSSHSKGSTWLTSACPERTARVLFATNAQPVVIAKAFLLARELVESLQRASFLHYNGHTHRAWCNNLDAPVKSVSSNHQERSFDTYFDVFIQLLQHESSEWDINNLLLAPDEWRVELTDPNPKDIHNLYSFARNNDNQKKREKNHRKKEM